MPAPRLGAGGRAAGARGRRPGSDSQDAAGLGQHSQFPHTVSGLARPGLGWGLTVATGEQVIVAMKGTIGLNSRPRASSRPF